MKQDAPKPQRSEQTKSTRPVFRQYKNRRFGKIRRKACRKQNRGRSQSSRQQSDRPRTIDRRRPPQRRASDNILVRGMTDLRGRQASETVKGGYTQRKGRRQAEPEETEIDRPDLREETTRDLPLPGSTVDAKPTQNEQKSYSTRIKREINSPSWTAAAKNQTEDSSKLSRKQPKPKRNTAKP